MHIPRVTTRPLALIRSLACAALIALSLASAGTAAPKTDEIRDQIKATLTEQAAAWSRGDLTAYLGFYENSPDITFVVTDTINRGFDTLRGIYEKVFNLKNMGTMRYDSMEITPLSDSTALSLCGYVIEVEKQPALGGIVTFAWKKTPQGWKIFHDQRSAGAPRGPRQQTSSGGLVIEDLVMGTGDAAITGKRVTVHYVGTFADGRKFDSSYDHGQPFTFNLGAREVIKGWDQGVVGMKIGGKRRLLIPAQLAYGSRGAGETIPPNTPLVFEIELLDVK